jgi:hypothetical protein
MTRGARIQVGAVAGLVGALVMDAVAVALSGPAGGWPALKCPAFPFAMHPGFNLQVLIASQLSHAMVSVAWGGAFGLAFANKRTTTVLLAGLLWGLVVLAGMYFVVLPACDMFGYVERSNLVYAVAIHLGYGVGLGIGAASLVAHRRHLSERRRDAWVTQNLSTT